MWHTKMQIALVEQDPKKIQDLLDTPLEFETKEEMKSAQYLLAQAFELIKTLQSETQNSMKKLKKNKEFLQSTQTKIRNKLDTRF